MTRIVYAEGSPVVYPLLLLSEEPVRARFRVQGDRVRVRILDADQRRARSTALGVFAIQLVGDPDEDSDDDAQALRDIEILQDAATTLDPELLGTDAAPALRRFKLGRAGEYRDLPAVVFNVLVPGLGPGRKVIAYLRPYGAPLMPFEQAMATWRDQKARRAERAQQRRLREEFAAAVAARLTAWLADQPVDTEGLAPAFSSGDRVIIRTDVLDQLAYAIEETS